MPRTREEGFDESADARGMPECCDSTMWILMFVFMTEQSRLLLSCAGLSVRLMPRHPMTVLSCGVCRMPVPCLVVPQVDLSFLGREAYFGMASTLSYPFFLPPLSLPFSFLPFSFEGTLTLLFEFFFTLRERDVEGSGQTKGRDIHRDTKRKQRSPVSVRAGGRGHGQ